MTEAKISVKDIMADLKVPTKDMLRALRELGLPSRSTSGSVEAADAVRLRDYFVSRKADAVETTKLESNVVVRRRRKDQQSPPEETSVKPETATEEKAPETPPEEPVEQKPVTKKSLRNVSARIISRPDDEPPAPTPAPPPAERPKPKKEPRPEKTLAEEIREREAAKKAEAQKAARELRETLTRDAKIIRPVEEEQPEPVAATPKEPALPIPEESVAQAPDKPEPAAPEPRPEEVSQTPRAPRVAMPDASAIPSGSSRPTLGRKPENVLPEKDERQSPQVRVISRPPSGTVPGRRPGPATPRQGADRGAYRTGEQRPGARPGANRPGMAARPAPAAPGRQAPAFPLQTPDAKDGQSKKKRLKGRRTVEFQQGDFGRHPEEDDTRLNRSKSRRKQAKAPAPQQPVTQPIKAAKRKLRIAEAIRIADMAQQLGVKANEIIKVLFGLGIMATINQSIDIDTASVVAAEFGYEVEKVGFSEDDYLLPKEEDAPEALKPRPPVVTIMGHVDHGKTSLLDAIRKSNVTSGEAGGITQHIGAYHVKTRRGEIVFLDTPGHEAFTAMRARGAQITDLVILVVAADDGVMEQTREAISHSRAANVPIVVAVNKMDKPGADPDRVLRELSELGLQPEDWGGDTIVAKVSAKTRTGLDDLLELVSLQAEIMDLKANPDKPARGHIVEAKLDKGRGPVATVLIQEGTLRPGDNFVCGAFSGRVRALTNDQGKKVKEAGPSLPVEVQGFDGVPEAGEPFQVVADDKVARRIADSRAIKRRERDLASESRVTLETFLAHANEEEAQTLNLVLKADVQGSEEAISEALNKLSTEKVKINIIHSGTGAISESDILLASASQAIVIGFNVRPTARIKDIAEKENVDIRFYDIIYKLADDVKSAMAGMLAPVQKEVYLGQAEVRNTFNLPKVGTIAGCYVSDGKLTRNAGVRLLRDGVVTYTGKIASLKRFKDDMREVVKGNECGVGLENYNDIKIGDIIEAFETVEEAATL